ncbi:hypothetical protein DL98DRAFT_524681 [Cadophora sp. DSE1049]|nr:hypothetical protein DL98DRAFT_524681 [Cadophora sp. DSE1049]
MAPRHISLWSYIRAIPNFRCYDKSQKTVLMSTLMSCPGIKADHYLREASLDMGIKPEGLILIATGEWELEQWNRTRLNTAACEEDNDESNLKDHELVPMSMDTLQDCLTRCYHRREVEPELETTRLVLMRREQASEFAVCDEVSRKGAGFSNRWMNLGMTHSFLTRNSEYARFIRLNILIQE